MEQLPYFDWYEYWIKFKQLVNMGPIYYSKCNNKVEQDEKWSLAKIFYYKTYTLDNLPVMYQKDGLTFKYIGNSNAIWDKDAYLDALKGKYIYCKFANSDKPICYIISSTRIPNLWECGELQLILLESLFYLAIDIKIDNSIPYSDCPIVYVETINNKIKVTDLGTLACPSFTVKYLTNNLVIGRNFYLEHSQPYIFILGSNSNYTIEDIFNNWYNNKYKLI